MFGLGVLADIVAASAADTGHLRLSAALAAHARVLRAGHLSQEPDPEAAHQIKGLPDALDLLVICAEAGLSLDAALVRVSRELERPGPS